MDSVIFIMLGSLYFGESKAVEESYIQGQSHKQGLCTLIICDRGRFPLCL